MALTNLVWMLTGLAAVVILITRTRLHATQRQSGVSDVPDAVLNVHTFAGVWALAFWVWTLLGAPSWAGRRVRSTSAAPTRCHAPRRRGIQ